MVARSKSRIARVSRASASAAPCLPASASASSLAWAVALTAFPRTASRAARSVCQTRERNSPVAAMVNVTISSFSMGKHASTIKRATSVVSV